MNYSLADYILTISDITEEFGLTNIQIGGQGSMTDSMSAARNKDMYETEGDDTGGYVHNKSYNKTGLINITLNQLSENVGKFKTLCNVYHRTAVQKGFTITLTDSEGNIICTGNDCMPKGIPEQAFAGTAGTQTWVLTCGVLEFN